MYDRETESYWSQILGKAVRGELTGTTLTPLTSLQTTWGQWRELYPDTLALRKGYSGSRDPYNSYYAGSQAGVLGETFKDDRLPTKSLGIGLIVNDTPAYYPSIALRDELVINDTVTDEPLLVIFRPAGFTGFVFKRTVDGQPLTFSLEDPEAEQLILVDAETGSRWDGFNGAAIEGTLTGKTLERLPSTTSFWFGWKDFHPDTYVYGLNAPE